MGLITKEDAKLFSTADTDAVEAGEWGWDSDEWDSHEYSTTLGKEIVKRNWDDGGSFDTNYSEFRHFSSENLAPMIECLGMFIMFLQKQELKILIIALITFMLVQAEVQIMHMAHSLMLIIQIKFYIKIYSGKYQ